MPIPQTEIALEDMYRFTEDGHVCGECGGRLNVASIGGKLVLRCGNNLEHHTITRHDYKEEKRMGAYGMETTALTKMAPKDMEVRVNMGRFSQDLSLLERKSLAVLAINYGFDPAMGEMTIYQGRPYISIDGRYRKAQETGKLDGVNTRPANKEERTEWDIPEHDYFYRAEVWVKGAGHPFIGWGRVNAAETTGGKGFKPVEKNPQRMAEKRAEAQALRKAFHIDLPSIEDIGTQDDPNTIEGEARVIQDPPAEVKPEAEMQASKATTQPEEYPATIGELFTWCISHGKTYNGLWAAKQVGYKSAQEIKDVKNAYLTIKQITGWEPYKKGGTEPKQ